MINQPRRDDRNMIRMKKRKNTILVTLLLMATIMPMQAQVFMMDDDNNPDRNVLNGNGTYGNVIFHGSGADQADFVPLGGGLLVMTALGSLYLVGKRKKQG